MKSLCLGSLWGFYCCDDSLFQPRYTVEQLLRQEAGLSGSVFLTTHFISMLVIVLAQSMIQKMILIMGLRGLPETLTPKFETLGPIWVYRRVYSE